MSTCALCGTPAGLFRKEHRECREKHDRGKGNITNLIWQAADPANSIIYLGDQIKVISGNSFLGENELHELCLRTWSSAVDRSLQDGVLSEDAEKRLLELMVPLSLSRTDLESAGAWEKVVKSAVIRDLLNGIVPQRVSFERDLVLNLQKGETIIWAFDRSDYLEDRTHREYVGGYGGVSLRVMKGVYYRVGGFKGQPIDRTERIHVDTGITAITTKHIYFVGPKKALRIPYTKIVSFEPFSDGIAVMRDALSAKHQFFVTHDGWFTFNLVTNLVRL